MEVLVLYIQTNDSRKITAGGAEQMAGTAPNLPHASQIVHPSFRDAEESRTGRITSEVAENKGGDSIAVSAISFAMPVGQPAATQQKLHAHDTTGTGVAEESSFAVMAVRPVVKQPTLSVSGNEDVEKPRRISRNQLLLLRKRLSKRDLGILSAAQTYRFITSEQIKRLFFTDGTTATANARAANKALKKLKEYGLVNHLNRIGGVRAGSSALIWHLTEPGQRLLCLDAHECTPRKRFEEPSQTFLNHTLAVAECAVQINETCRAHAELSIVRLATEPSCWQTFTEEGKTVYVKPDLFLILATGEYWDYYFVEIDLGTEPYPKLLKKCRLYYSYYRSMTFQNEEGVFPYILWLVEDEVRKNILLQKIHAEFPHDTLLFRVATPAELGDILYQDTPLGGAASGALEDEC